MRYAGLSLLTGLLVAQTYTHPTTGQQNTFSGGCQVHTCSGNYYDNGGAGANYSNNIPLIYWTFCPNNPNQCLRVTFSSFSIESGCLLWRCALFHLGYSLIGEPCCYDWLAVRNGPAQNSPSLFWGCGTTNPGTFTSSDASGCLTFVFCSDGSVTQPGWAATFSCVNCTRQPTGNSDCQQSTPVCSNSGISDFSYGPGTSPQCGGCVTNENYTNFYIFRPTGASGNIQLSICPSNGTDDYDFAIWGPFNTGDPSLLCSGLGAPVRCSYAMYPRSGGCGANTACTGMASGNNDVSEDVCGNGWVAPLSVTAGQYYILMVNGWTAGAQGYNLTWTLPSGMNLDCNPLSQPITRLSAQAIAGRGILLSWDVDPDRIPQGQRLVGFGVERTVDEGQTWTTIATLPASMSSYIDPQPVLGVNGYRLRYQYGDGSHEVYVKPAWVEWHSSYGAPFRAWWRADQDALHIEIFDNGLGGAVEVYTVDGRLLRKIPVDPNPFISAVGLPGLSAGTYLVRYGDLTQAVVVPRAN
jgi:hypothetical protein